MKCKQQAAHQKVSGLLLEFYSARIDLACSATASRMSAGTFNISRASLRLVFPLVERMRLTTQSTVPFSSPLCSLSLTPPTIEIVGFLGGSGKAYHHAAYKAASYAVSHHPLRV